MRLVAFLLAVFLPTLLFSQVDPPYPNSPAAPVNVVAAEYFFDSDPGYGNGTAISITAGVNISAINLNADITGLANGVHTLFVRTKNADNEWSQTSSKVFLIEVDYPAPPPALQNVVRAEYFFNADPGIGQGNPITFTANTDVDVNSLNLDISSLPNGVNTLFVRTKNADDEWSQTSSKSFLIERDYGPAPPAAQNIVRAEYFIDTDPGIGSGTSIPVPTPGPDVSLSNVSINTTGLTNGVHRVYLRTKNADDEWSQTSVREFIVLFDPTYPSAPTAATNITRVEYFVDTDPGVGLGTNIPITPGQSISLSNVDIATSTLLPGIHRVYLRTKNADDEWSQTSVRDFTVLFDPQYPSAPVAPSDIVRAEYFVDTDPGIGLGTDIPLTPGQDLTLNNVSVSTTGLLPGIHRVYLRTKNADDEWSQTSVRDFEVQLDPPYPTAPATPTNIIAAEYFIDVDPGYGQGTDITVTPGQDITITNESIDVVGLAPGPHTLFLRTKNADNEWSQTSNTTFNMPATDNTALNFDGVDDEVQIVENASLQFGTGDFSIEATIYYDGTNQVGSIVTKRNPNSPFNQYTLRIGNGINNPAGGKRVEAILLTDGRSGSGSEEANDRAITSTSDLSIGWHHVALVQDYDTDLKLYIDGVLAGTDADSHGGKTLNIPGQDVYIGSVGGSFYYNNSIDEVRIWNRALCLEEIQGRADAPLQGNENGLLAYYNFEEGNPGGDNSVLSQIEDQAGTNTGTLNNFDKGATPPGNSSNWVGGTVLSGNSSFSATTVTWQGNTADWNTASNWFPAIVPGQCSDVIIPITANDPLFSNNQAVNSIEIQTGATLTMQGGGCLWVGSTFTNNGDFILQASSSSYAQYQGPQVQGTMQQVIGESGWHTIASPFTDATLGDVTFDQNAFLQFGASNLCNIQYYDPSEYNNSPQPGSANAWGSWVCATGASDPFNGSRGYNLYLDDVYFADALPVTLEVSGTLRNTPITHNLNGANGGWNKLSNPFPSVIDWEKWNDNGDINNTYYLWSAADANYITYQSGGLATLGASRYIAPFQSVFVKTSNGAITDPLSDEVDVFQVHLASNADRPTECPSAINSFYKTQSSGALHLMATTADQVYKDELVIRFGDAFSEGYNTDEEAAKFFSPEPEIPSFYALIENRPYVISAFPNPQQAVKHIPLGIQTETQQEIEIAAVEIPRDITVYLEDKEAGIFYNLNSPYRFKATNNVDNNRFKLHIGDENLGPNELGADDDYLVYQKNKKLIFVYNQKLFGGQAQLLSTSGQLLAKAKVCDGCTMNVNALPIGMYIMMVEANGKIYSQKVFVR